MKVKLDDLKKAAKELNEVVEPDPPIKVTTRTKEKDLTDAIVDVSSLLEDGDQVTQATADVLEAIEADMPAKLKIIKTKSTVKKGRKPVVKGNKPLLPKELNKAERTKYGSVVGTAHGLLDELFMKGSSRKAMVTALEKKFPERYPGDEDSVRRCNLIINQHKKDLIKGARTGGKPAKVTESEQGVIKVA